MLVAVLFSAGINIVMLALPVLAWQVVDKVVPTGSLDTLAVMVLVVVAALLTAAVVGLARDLVLLRVGLWLDHVHGLAILAREVRGLAVDLKHGPNEVWPLIERIAVRAEHHIQRAHLGPIRILDELADSGRQADSRSRLGADIGIDVAPGQRDMHLRERDPHRRDVTNAEALHPHALQRENLLCATRPDRNALALQVLDGADVRVLLRDDRHATVAGGRDHHDRFAGCRAESSGCDAEGAKIHGLRDDRILAFARALERYDLDRDAFGLETLVEMRSDRVDQLERPHPDHGRRGLRTRHERC